MDPQNVRKRERSIRMGRIGWLGQCSMTCFILLTFAILSAASETDDLQLVAISPEKGVTTPGSKVLLSGSGFSPDASVYFGGLQARDARFVSPSSLEVVTPYLRPGTYQILLKCRGTTFRSNVSFTVLPAKIDSDFDRASAFAEKRQTSAAIEILSVIAMTNSDYQVRAFAHYQAALSYFAEGDWWRWGGEAFGIFDDSDKSGDAVQTSWRYRLILNQSEYFLPVNNDPDQDLKLADFTVEKDVTENPEPRFFRGLVNARYGNLEKAKTDCGFILLQEPSNPAYRALAAYVAVLSGDPTQLRSLAGENITEARALSLLGEAAYLSGDVAGARQWWGLAAKAYPLGAGLAYLAGKRHLARGQRRVAEALLAECVTMAPDSKEAKEAKDLLGKSVGPAF